MALTKRLGFGIKPSHYMVLAPQAVPQRATGVGSWSSRAVLRVCRRSLAASLFHQYSAGYWRWQREVPGYELKYGTPNRRDGRGLWPSAWAQTLAEEVVAVVWRVECLVPCPQRRRHEWTSPGNTSFVGGSVQPRRRAPCRWPRQLFASSCRSRQSGLFGAVDQCHRAHHD